MLLYDFWRSTAAWRVRIVLRLKGLQHDAEILNLPRGDQRADAYKAVNPQGLVPFLTDGAAAMSQSLAIIEYLDETYPEPRLLPRDPIERANVRALAQVIACDIHPLNNLRVQNYLRQELAVPQPDVEAWARTWIDEGFVALEAAAQKGGGYMFGGRLTLADVCLLPQLYNARRVFTDLDRYPALLAIEERLKDLPAFADAVPDRQSDALPV